MRLGKGWCRQSFSGATNLSDRSGGSLPDLPAMLTLRTQIVTGFTTSQRLLRMGCNHTATIRHQISCVNSAGPGCIAEHVLVHQFQAGSMPGDQMRRQAQGFETMSHIRQATSGLGNEGQVSRRPSRPMTVTALTGESKAPPSPTMQLATMRSRFLT